MLIFLPFFLFFFPFIRLFDFAKSDVTARDCIMVLQPLIRCAADHLVRQEQRQ